MNGADSPWHLFLQEHKTIGSIQLGSRFKKAGINMKGTLIVPEMVKYYDKHFSSITFI